MKLKFRNGLILIYSRSNSFRRPAAVERCFYRCTERGEDRFIGAGVSKKDRIEVKTLQQISFKHLLLGVLLLFTYFGFGEPANNPARKQFTILFYNVENLFDTLDDKHIQDNEFLPGSKKNWNTTKYEKKVNDIARVIASVSPSDFPELVGLCEIENRSVLNDLVRAESIRGSRYQIIQEESPDPRGIDVALLYRPGEFREISHEAIPVRYENDPKNKTRDILYVYGKLGDQPVHIFVNHWPSRVGGEEESEAKRVWAASVLRKKVDEILAKDPSARVMIMGDMNDEPTSKSLSETLGAAGPKSGAKLVNLMLPEKEAGHGSYYYRGDWNMLDNLVVSSGLLFGKKLKVVAGKGFIFSQDWMIFETKNGDKSPNRTYAGEKYTGGVSDHFPVYFKLSAN
jgi:endonuclease/exonuclease/phosphatase family metal-dependent hydrolase